MGGVQTTGKMLENECEVKSVSTLPRLRFEPGSRSNWHSQSNSKILMTEEGWDHTQIRGEEIVELVPDRPVQVRTNVAH
jgi:hypothetical protein